MMLDPVLGSQRTYRRLLAAFSHPGHPVAGPRWLDDEAAAVLLTLVDENTTLAGSDPWPSPAVAAPAADPAHADFWWCPTDPGDALARARTGAPDTPEAGATVVIASTHRTTVRLSGPGLPAPVDVVLAVSTAALRARATLVDRPFGIDLVLVGADRDRLVALPRSTEVEF